MVTLFKLAVISQNLHVWGQFYEVKLNLYPDVILKIVMKHSSTDVFSSSPGQIPAAPQALGWGSRQNEVGMSWAEVSDLARSGPQLWPPSLSEHKDEGSRAELSRCHVSQAVHQCSVCAVPVSSAQPHFLLAAPLQRTRGGWEGCGVPPLHLVLHASVRMSACT